MTNVITVSNKNYDSWTLRAIHDNSQEVRNLIAEYAKEPNCRPFDWINSEPLTDAKKACFIYYATPYFNSMMRVLREQHID